MRYLHLDVFTDRPFEGNQLAVFPEPQGLTTLQMQSIAREMNFSESTFIFPPEAGGDFRMRIFTPGEELPMAGHPTIGSTFALAAEGALERGRPEFVFELGVGPTPVSLEWGDAGLSFAWMTQQLPAFGAIVADRAGFAAAVGLDEPDLAAGLPVQSVSCGVPFLFAAIATRRAVDRVAIDRRALAKSCASAGIGELPVFFFTTEPGRPGAGFKTEGGVRLQPDHAGLETDAAKAGETVYSRMLAPGFGIAEDPATGSASGPVGCYLVQHFVVSPDAAQSMVSLQGVAMKRPSRIYISIEGRPGAITRVRVGGQSVLVGRGELTVDGV